MIVKVNSEAAQNYFCEILGLPKGKIPYIQYSFYV